MDYLTILSGFIIGVLTPILGYIKTTKPEDFDWVKFVGTAIIGLAVGVATSFLGYSVTQVETWLSEGAVTVWIYWIAKIIVDKASGK